MALPGPGPGGPASGAGGPRIGWVGLGAMGAPMARRLLSAGFEVVGFDIDKRSLEAFERDGGSTASSAAEAAAAADVLVLMVASSEHGDAVLVSAGAAGALRAGSIVLVGATVGDRAIREWETLLAARGVRVVDAPVSGGVARAASGDLLIMPAGRREDLDVVDPLFAQWSSRHRPVGRAVGDGQRMKLVNQLLCGVHIAAAAEALAFAEALGLDARTAWDVVRQGAAASFMLDDRGARMLEEDPPVRSSVSIFVKDLGLVVDAARTHGMSPTLASAAEERFVAAAVRGLSRADDSRVIDVYRHELGVGSPDE